jgi:Putative addiction module component
MKPQIIKDSEGKNTGVFIPFDEWTKIKNNYPDIENIDTNIPEWQKEIIDSRLEDIAKNPSSLRPISELIDILKNEV